MTFAFSFDASACSGCKACQAACKDKNNLPLGVLWRRNYEVGGGEWKHTGKAWVSTLYAYYLSMACNHCVHPKCAGVCPVNAFHVREDGIVLLDSSKCIGCGYCAWACPYGAPQYDRTTGSMTKCDLCYDNIDVGLPPACVASCPMRVLNLGKQSDLEAQGLKSSIIFPMPPTSRTEPRIYIKPHPAAETALQLPQILNLEEYTPSRKRVSTWASRSEIPLLFFTLLGQMAVGLSWILGTLTFFNVTYLSSLYLAIGIIMGLGLMISFLHLGSPKNAWRVFFNLKKSWLSREILAALLFMLSWAITSIIFRLPGSLEISKILMSEITSLTGLALVFSMSEVYRLRMVPAWNTWRTKATFLLTTAILGIFSAGIMLVLTGGLNADLLNFLIWISVLGIFFLSIELALCYKDEGNSGQAYHYARKGLIIFGIISAILLVFSPPQSRILTVIGIFPVVMVEELIGRWVFYSSRNPMM